MSSLKAATSYVSCSLNEPVKIRASNKSLAKLPPKTISAVFQESCEKYKNLPALAFEKDVNANVNTLKLGETIESSWSTVTYDEYRRNVEKAALILLHLGVPARSSVSIMAFNCPEWFYLQMAALRINAVSAGIYITNSAEAVYHILETSDAAVVVVDGTQQLEKIRAIKSRLPKLRAVIQLHEPFDFTEAEQKDGYYRWCDLMHMKFDDAAHLKLEAREREVAANDCALLIFTSGTVGMPKGCMISHDGILHAANSLASSIPNAQPGNEVIVSFLPLNHIAAQIFEVFVSLKLGSLVYFADRNALKGTISRTFLNARPTLISSVPRVLEKMQENLTNASKTTFWSPMQFIEATARETLLQYHLDRMDGRPRSDLKCKLASYATQRLRSALGFDRVKMIHIGGAPMSEELKCFFMSLDLPLCDIYGMSEASGAVTLNTHNLRSVGKTLMGFEVKIRNADKKGEGEVLIKSRSNFMGYLKDAEKTKAAFDKDGWICTGDMGYIDGNGLLYISGRIKELIITSAGLKVPPVYIEDLIKKELPCVNNAVVIGDRRKYLTVLLTLRTHTDSATGYPLDTLTSETTEWLARLGLDYTHLSHLLQIHLPTNLKDFDPCSVEPRPDEKVQKALEEGIQRVNQQAISNAHKIQYLTVLPHIFSIATNEIGPTLKVRRNIVHSKYAKFIENMYRISS